MSEKITVDVLREWAENGDDEFPVMAWTTPNVMRSIGMTERELRQALVKALEAAQAQSYELLSDDETLLTREDIALADSLAPFAFPTGTREAL